MKRLRPLFLMCGLFLPCLLSAQQTTSPAPLNAVQQHGQRVFQQRCGVCHSQVMAAYPMYGPALYKNLVIGNEDAIKEMIRTGTAKMPGFRYGLQSSDIDAIVEYLKVVPKPAKSTGPTKAPQGPLD